MSMADAPTASASAEPLPKSSTLVRLHITPLNPDIYNSLVPAPLRDLASTIGSGPSYHAVQAFPERGYGFIELPAGDAQRLRQKLHGTTLRGMKVRVEAARPKRKAGTDEAADVPAAEAVDKKHREKRAKVSSTRDDGVLRGVEMPADRVVKRGWAEKTTSKDERRKHKKSSSTDEKKSKKAKEVDTGQMIFRTRVPPNVASKVDPAREGSKKEKKKSKSSKASAKIPTEVKEFDKTTKFPAFLRDDQVEKDPGKGVREFVEDKGWVDAKGNVVEQVDVSKRAKRRSELSLTLQKERDEGSKSTSKNDMPQDVKEAQDQDDSEDSDESSVVSSDTESESESDLELDKPSSTSPTSAAPVLEPPIELKSPATPEKEVHPLEALFKRPASREKKLETLAPINTAFSFFGEQDREAGDAVDVAMRPPQTPFTQRDLESRGQRSAAPTPDTAAIGKRFRLPSISSTEQEKEEDGSAGHGNDDDKSSDGRRQDDNSNDDYDNDYTNKIGSNSPIASSMAQREPPPPLPTLAEDEAEDDQTEFERHFWQHRGEYNRAWKQRKREARKERRQAENRRGGGGGGGGVVTSSAARAR